MNNIEKINLLRCPLCGGNPKCTSTEYNWDAWVYVYCKNCGLTLKGKKFHITHHCKGQYLRDRRNETKKLWNNRNN